VKLGWFISALRRTFEAWCCCWSDPLLEKRGNYFLFSFTPKTSLWMCLRVR